MRRAQPTADPHPRPPLAPLASVWQACGKPTSLAEFCTAVCTETEGAPNSELTQTKNAPGAVGHQGHLRGRPNHNTRKRALTPQVRSNIKDIYGLDPEAPTVSTPIRCAACGKPTLKPTTVLFGGSMWRPELAGNAYNTTFRRPRCATHTIKRPRNRIESRRVPKS